MNIRDVIVEVLRSKPLDRVQLDIALGERGYENSRVIATALNGLLNDKLVVEEGPRGFRVKRPLPPPTTPLDPDAEPWEDPLAGTPLPALDNENGAGQGIPGLDHLSAANSVLTRTQPGQRPGR